MNSNFFKKNLGIPVKMRGPCNLVALYLYLQVIICTLDAYFGCFADKFSEQKWGYVPHCFRLGTLDGLHPL